MKKWARRKDEVHVFAIHKGRVMEHARAKPIIHELAQKENEQRTQRETMEDQLRHVQLLYEEAAHKLQWTEHALSESRKRVEELATANNTLQAGVARQGADMVALRAKNTTLSEKIQAKEATTASAEAQAAAERAARVEQIGARLLRHAMNRNLSRGFSTWTEFANARAVAYRRLRHASDRMLSVNRSRSFQHWVSTWKAQVRQARNKAHISVRAARQEAAARAQEQARAAEAAVREAEQAESMAVVADLLRQLGERRAEVEAVIAERTLSEASWREKERNWQRSLEEERLALKTSAEAQLEAHRVEHVNQVSAQLMRHAVSRDLSYGFTTWASYSETQGSALRKYRRAVNGMMRRHEKRAFGKWTSMWRARGRKSHAAEVATQQAAAIAREQVRAAEAAARMAEVMDQEGRVTLMLEELRKREAEVEALRSEWEQQQSRKEAAFRTEQRKAEAEWHQKQQQMEALQADSLRDAEAKQSEAEAAWREKERQWEASQAEVVRNAASQIMTVFEHLHRNSMRRMLNQGLNVGFRAWVELVEARNYGRQRLRQAASRLHAPDKVHAFRLWTEVVEATKRAAKVTAQEEMLAELVNKLSDAEEELVRLRRENDQRSNARMRERVARRTVNAASTS